jgi:RNA polymerase sigma factor (TIGR02999 family)
MNDVTRILSAIERGDSRASEELLPLVYDELRKLAAQRLARERPGQTLQATALVYEAYLRLVDTEEARQWNSRGHFFAAAAEAMRRILIDSARRERAEKRGRGDHRGELEQAEAAARLHHTKIVQVYSIGEDDGCHLLAADFTGGIIS